MLYKNKQLPELYYLKHFHDNDKDYVDYESTILTKTLSPYIFQNDLMNSFLLRLQPLVSIFFDQMNIIRNFKKYTVDKDYFR